MTVPRLARTSASFGSSLQAVVSAASAWSSLPAPKYAMPRFDHSTGLLVLSWVACSYASIDLSRTFFCLYRLPSDAHAIACFGIWATASCIAVIASSVFPSVLNASPSLYEASALLSAKAGAENRRPRATAKRASMRMPEIVSAVATLRPLRRALHRSRPHLATSPTVAESRWRRWRPLAPRQGRPRRAGTSRAPRRGCASARRAARDSGGSARDTSPGPRARRAPTGTAPSLPRPSPPHG